MLRFSDRLTSTSSTTPEQVKAAPADIGGSDETPKLSNGEALTSTDHEYSALVELLGLHQTVRALEAEYRVVTGADSPVSEALQIKRG
jgi:hypothetical protein